MLKSLKKFLVIVPCMILAFFLFSGVKTMAKDAVLIGAEKEVIGAESKENTYYFSNSTTWEFRSVSNPVKEWDTYLKWRVVAPNGMATEWSGKDYYVDNDDKFIINNYKELSYTVNLGLDGRISVAPAQTYYVDIEYYASFLYMFDKHQDKDETIKIVVAENKDLATPVVNVEYNDVTDKFSIAASFKQAGYGIITDVEYLFASEDKNISNYSGFTAAKKGAIREGAISITPSSAINTTLSGESSATMLYVAVKTGNDYITVVSFDMTSPDNNNNNPSNPSQDTDFKDNQENKSDGLFDYGIGQLILIILVIVLIVSCALIITQKIVDYKKRLY